MSVGALTLRGFHPTECADHTLCRCERPHLQPGETHHRPFTHRLANAPGPTGTVFVPVQPCRVVDTRKASGRFTLDVTRDYQVTDTGTGFATQGGNANGDGIPADAAAVETTVRAVSPIANGYLRSWP